MDFYIILLDVDSKVIANSLTRCDYWLVLTFYICLLKWSFLADHLLLLMLDKKNQIFTLLYKHVSMEVKPLIA